MNLMEWEADEENEIQLSLVELKAYKIPDDIFKESIIEYD